MKRVYSEAFSGLRWGNADLDWALLWTGLQADYDLRLVRCEKAGTIEREVEPLAALQPVAA